jgi:hypothetical protein
MMNHSKFTAVMDECEKDIKAKVAEIVSLAHGMTRDGRKTLATKLEEVLAKVKGDAAKSDTAVIGTAQKIAAGPDNENGNAD